jgi:hypothetical protein
MLMQFSKILVDIIDFSFYSNLSRIANLAEISLRDPFGAEQSFIPEYRDSGFSG